MILLIDNYDSFVHNLARYLERLGQTTEVVRNNKIDAAGIRQLAPQAVVVSPGPCTPTEAGCSINVVRELAGSLPILGICLGHQAIAAALGGQVVRAPVPMHGRTSLVRHQASRLFRKIPSPFRACRYHSLVVDPKTLDKQFRVTATTDDGTVMAIEHSTHSLFGVQFHPEAILTEHGYQLLANFLSISGVSLPSGIDRLSATERVTAEPAPPALPRQPVTF